jgi:hypothetical protein
MKMLYAFFAALLLAGALIQPVSTVEKRSAGIKGSFSSLPMPDLRVAQIIAPASAEAGQYIGPQLKTTIQNSGDAPAPGTLGTLNPPKGFQVDFVFSKDNTAPVKYAVLSSNFVEDMLMLGYRFSRTKDLAAKGVASYPQGTGFPDDARIPPDTKPGNYFVCVVVDPGKVVPESNENNNVMCKSIVITPQKTFPDLTIKQYQVVDAKQGKIKYLLKNQGNADAPACIVDTWLPIKPGSEEHYHRTSPAIAKGQEVWMEVTIGYDVSGRKFGAWVDAYEDITESVENNNTTFGKF